MANVCNIKEFPDYYVTDCGEVYSIGGFGWEYDKTNNQKEGK